MLAFALGDTLTPGVDPESVLGRLGDPGADRGAFRRGSLVDRIGEVRGK